MGFTLRFARNMQSALEIFTRTRGSSPAEIRAPLPPASVKHEVAATHTLHSVQTPLSLLHGVRRPQAPSVSPSGVLHPQELCLRVMSTAAQPFSGCHTLCQPPSRRRRLSVQSQGPSPTLLLSMLRRSRIFSVCCSSVTLDLEPIDYPCTVTHHPTHQSVS